MINWQLFVAPFVLHVFVAGGLAFACVAVLDKAFRLAPRSRMVLYAATLVVPFASFFVYYTHIFGRCSVLFGPFAWRICSVSRLYADVLAPVTAVTLVVYLGMRVWRYLASPLRLSRLVADQAPRQRVMKLLNDLKAPTGLKITVFANHYPSLFVRDTDESEIAMTTGMLELLSDAELSAALAHEMAHIRGRDGIWNLVYWLKEASFFSPLAHLAYRRYHQAREEAADATVDEAQRLELASALLKVLRLSHELVGLAKWRWLENFLVGGSDTKRRIELLLSPRQTYFPLPLGVPMAMLLAIVLLIC